MWVETHNPVFRTVNRVVRPLSVVDSIEIQHYRSISKYARDDNSVGYEPTNVKVNKNLARIVLNCSDGRVFATSTSYFRNANEHLRSVASQLGEFLGLSVYTDLSDDEGNEDKGSEWFITEKEKERERNNKGSSNATELQEHDGGIKKRR